MNFKKSRYNLIVIGLIALVCCYMGMSIFFAPSSGNINNPGSAQEEPEDDPLLPEEPAEDVGSGDGKVENEIPSDAIELINYGMDILNSGPGFECIYTASIMNTPKGMPEINPVQIQSSIISRGVNSKGEKVGIQKDFYYANYSGIGDTMLARYFRGYYDNQTTGQINIIETKDYSAMEKTYNASAAYRNETVSYDAIVDEFKIIYTRDFPVKFTQKNCTIIKDDSKKSKTYRTITVSVKINTLSQEFLDFYTSSKQIKDIDYQKVEITFVINKNNGYIAKINRNELLNATGINIPVLGTMGVQSSISVEQTFTSMNKEIVLPDSL